MKWNHQQPKQFPFFPLVGHVVTNRWLGATHAQIHPWTKDFAGERPEVSHVIASYIGSLLPFVALSMSKCHPKRAHPKVAHVQNFHNFFLLGFHAIFD